MPRRHLVSAGCAAVVVLFGAVLSRDARAEFQNGEFFTYTQASWGDSIQQGGMILVAHYDTVYSSTFGQLEVGQGFDVYIAPFVHLIKGNFAT